jgi:hypothetical protein
MITGLPADFQAQIDSIDRSPAILLHIFIGSEVYYISDTVIGAADGLSHEYLPFVEDWGTLTDSSNINTFFEGGALEIRSVTLSLINGPDSYAFIRALYENGVENTKVEIYQWFYGVSEADMQLIDVMVCQDPITLTEASMLLAVDMVSIIMINNPYLFESHTGDESLPVVIGKVEGVPMIDLKTARSTTLVEEIGDGSANSTAPQTGEFLISNGVGFPAGTGSTTVYIDSELVKYDMVSAAGIRVTARAQGGTTKRIHRVGAHITIPNAKYDYAICAGPVKTVDNFQANGEPYINPVNFITSGDPVIARFIDRPPWLKIKTTGGGSTQPPPETVYGQFGSRYESAYSGGAKAPSGLGSINREASSAAFNIESTVGGGTYDANKLVQIPILKSETNTFQKQSSAPPTGWEDMLQRDTTVNASVGIRIDTTNKLATNDGISGDVIVVFDGDLTGVGGTLVSGSVKMRVTYDSINVVRRSKGKLKVSFINVDGSTSRLLHDETLENDSASVGADTYATFNNKTLQYDNIPVGTLAEFTNSGIKLEYENTEVNPDRGAWFQYTKGSVGIMQFEFLFQYYVAPGTVPIPTQQGLSRFDRDLSSYGGLVDVKVTVRVSSTDNCDREISIIRRQTNQPADNQTLATINPVAAMTTYGPYTLSGVTSWTDLKNARVGLYQKITGPSTAGFVRELKTAVQWVKWDITYDPNAIQNPDEKRIVYAEELLVDVESDMGADPTPPEVIQSLIEKYTPNGASYIDAVSFADEIASYTADGYFLNGAIDGEFRLHDGLRKILFEGMLRLLFNQGKIKLLSYKTDSSAVVDMSIGNSQVVLRSKTINNQPIEIIKNDITIQYKRQLHTGVYKGKKHVVDTGSIAKFTLKEERRRYDLITSDTIAELIANRLLEIDKGPQSIHKFKVMMPRGYQLEKGDKVVFPLLMPKSLYGKGNVLTMSRTFPSGKNEQISTYEVSVLNPISGVDNPEGFISVWKTTMTDESITLPATGNNDFFIDWGDGVHEHVNTSYPTHIYATAGDHTVTIDGYCPEWYQNDSGDKDKLIEVKQLGFCHWTSLEHAFWGCSNLMDFKAGPCDTSRVTNMSHMLAGLDNMVNTPDLTGLDTSNCTWFYGMLYNWPKVAVAPDLSGFNMGVAFNINQMVSRWLVITPAGDIGIEKWDISSVESAELFADQTTFTPEAYDHILISWEAQNTNQLITHFKSQYNCGPASNARHNLIVDRHWVIIDQGPVVSPCYTVDDFVSVWRTTTANETITLPAVATDNNFDIDWGDGHTGNTQATYPHHTYDAPGDYTIVIQGICKKWSQNNAGDKDKLIEVKQLGSVGWIDLFAAFNGCQNLTHFTAKPCNLSMVTTFKTMLANIKGALHIDLHGMDTENVSIIMNFIAYSNLYQLGEIGIETWDISSVVDARQFATNAGFTTPAYDKILIAWAAQNVHDDIVIDFGTSKYTAGGLANIARDKLINDHNWTITDGGGI